MKLGWCMTGHHAGRTYEVGTPCPGKTHDKSMTCSCSCHGGPDAETGLRTTDDALDGGAVLVPEGAGEADVQVAPAPESKPRGAKKRR